jgi:hypothetical protein
VYGHPLARGHASLRDDSPVRGDESTSEAGRLYELDVFGEPDEVGVRITDGDQFGK